MPEMPNGAMSDQDKEMASSPKHPDGFATPMATPARGLNVSMLCFMFYHDKYAVFRIMIEILLAAM